MEATVAFPGPLAYGRTAEIYAWGEGQILKLFYPWFALENIEVEARITRTIHASGLPAPAVGDLIRVNGRYGLLYERVRGDSLFRIFQHRPWNVLRYARQMAKLQAEIHARTPSAALPSQRAMLRRNILQAEALPAELRRRVLAALDALPDGDRLCHGDFHPGNILVDGQRYVIIDWIHASLGNPLADLARTTNLTLGLTRTRQIDRPFNSFGPRGLSRVENPLFQVFCGICYPYYVRCYFRLCPGGETEYGRWLPIIAAARLSDNIPELEKMLLEQARKVA